MQRGECVVLNERYITYFVLLKNKEKRKKKFREYEHTMGHNMKCTLQNTWH
jgi:hypothetical protein